MQQRTMWHRESCAVVEEPEGGRTERGSAPLELPGGGAEVRADDRLRGGKAMGLTKEVARRGAERVPVRDCRAFDERAEWQGKLEGDRE